MHTENITIDGLDGSAGSIPDLTKIARELPGVEAAYASLPHGQVTVQYDERQTSPSRLKQAIEKVRYFTGYAPLSF